MSLSDSWDSADQEEFDRLLAIHEKVYKPRKIPDDLRRLMEAIRDETYLRHVVPDNPPYSFEGYGAYDVHFGGMGMVIEAEDTELDRKVAIKLWAKSSARAEASLLAEAKTLAKLAHPNIVTVYGTGRWRGHVYFVMEWIEGMDGHAWLAQPRGWREVREVFIGAGEGLAAAHDAEIQHRDFKPANMLVGADGRVRVADFGVAVSLGSDEVGEDSSPDSYPAGTPVYMAPERLRGERGDARSDQFSFCVALWRGLHGYRPFDGESLDELLEAIETGAILPGDPASDVPHWLSRVVRKGLEPDPDRRWADMRELLRALQDEPPEQDEVFGEGEGDVDERPEGVVMHAPKSEPKERNWRLYFYATLVAGLVVLAGLLAMALAGRGQPPPVGPSPVEPSEPTLTPPERVLEQIAGACTIAPGTAMVGQEEFWKTCEAELVEAHRSWESELKKRELKGHATYHDSADIGRAFLQKSITIRTAGGLHSCSLLGDRQLSCQKFTVSASSSPSTEQLKSSRTAARKATRWGHAALADLERDHQSTAANYSSHRTQDRKAVKAAASSLVEISLELAADLSEQIASQSK